MSSTPETTACGSASPIPAAPVIGHAVKQAPHLVHASSMSSTRAARAASNAVALMGFAVRCPLLRPFLEVFFLDLRQLLQERHDRPDFRISHAGRAEARHAGHVDAVLD